MALKEKYGNFAFYDLVFYDEVERDHFSEVIESTYKNYISKVNKKKVIGHGKLKRTTDEEKRYLGLLNMQLTKDDENGITKIVGYGHRRVIFPLQFYVRQLFDEGRIVSYEATDNLNRSIHFSDEEIDEDLRQFFAERKRRLELFKKGELEPPKYRQEEAKQNKKTL